MTTYPKPLSTLPTKELASRVVAELISCNGNLNGWAAVLTAVFDILRRPEELDILQETPSSRRWDDICLLREAADMAQFSDLPEFIKGPLFRLVEHQQYCEGPFQQRVLPWMMQCFGKEISSDREERNHRFLEEALELVQACGATREECYQLVDYVYDRPVGEKPQEVGGVMVTLAALCLAQGLDMVECGDVELARIWTKVEQIRAKQAAKPKHSPLPGYTPPTGNTIPTNAGKWLWTHDLYTDADKDRPEQICDSNGQVTLGLCRKCGRAEIELTQPCLVDPCTVVNRLDELDPTHGAV